MKKRCVTSLIAAGSGCTKVKTFVNPFSYEYIFIEGIIKTGGAEKLMARIAGVDLPNEKRVEYGLTYVYGIGVKSSNKILAEAGINPDTRVKDLTEDEVSKIREIIDRDYTVEGDLRRQIALDIKRLIEIGCYRGLRHRRGLPVRGQNTKNNARTRKGPKRTIAGKKK